MKNFGYKFFQNIKENRDQQILLTGIVLGVVGAVVGIIILQLCLTLF
jgi:uncharacterized membrane protein YeaQ/YmgE (transglycosylase-associated protein family)